MNSQQKIFVLVTATLLLILLVCISQNLSNAEKSFINKRKRFYSRVGLPQASKPKKHMPQYSEKKISGQRQQKICIPADDTVKAKRRVCLLRPDSGPCRADILSWYYDAKQKKCYRFFWGGCQGNGNRYDTHKQCIAKCYLNATMSSTHTPHFCNLPFDFGTCYGQYNRWTWDRYEKSCKRRLYSGCGGNRNNFETKSECLQTCLIIPNNTMQHSHVYTTCIPYTFHDLN